MLPRVTWVKMNNTARVCTITVSRYPLKCCKEWEERISFIFIHSFMKFKFQRTPIESGLPVKIYGLLYVSSVSSAVVGLVVIWRRGLAYSRIHSIWIDRMTPTQTFKVLVNFLLSLFSCKPWLMWFYKKKRNSLIPLSFTTFKTEKMPGAHWLFSFNFRIFFSLTFPLFLD